MPSAEVMMFLAATLLAGGLTMGGVTLVFFLDQWRAEAPPRSADAEREASPFDRAA